MVLLRGLASSSRAWANCTLTSAPLGGEEGGALGPAPKRGPVPGPGGTSLSPASTALVAFARSLVIMTQHSHAGS
jgi:hypothetical protein